MKDRNIFVLLFTITLCLCLGCEEYVSRIQSGSYVVIDVEGENPGDGPNIRDMTLEINRDQDRAVFTLADGTEMTYWFVPRPKSQWAEGCPKSLGSTDMEILDIEEEMIMFETTVFNNPIFVAECPEDSNEVVFREDGAIGGQEGACPEPGQKCIRFELQVEE